MRKRTLCPMQTAMPQTNLQKSDRGRITKTRLFKYIENFT